MIPILYEANETAFTTQGIGALGDAVSVKIARVLNGKDELTMVYPNEGIRYADLQNDRIIYAEPEYKKGAQPYQIYKITKPMNGLVTVYARHVGTQRSSFIPVLPFSDGSVVGVLNKLPLNMVETNPFTFWTNKDTVADFELTRPASLGNVLGGKAGSILDVYGGEYEFDGYTIRLWNKRGADRGVELRYGKNITDIEQSEDFSSVVTGVVPYWEGMDGESVTLPEHAVYGSLASTYPFARTIVKDFSESFDDQPTEAQLRAAALNYVEDAQLPNVNLKVNFEHLAQYTEYEGIGLLETVNLGDTVHIYYEPLGVSKSARIVNTTYDSLNEKYDSVQIGSVRGNLEQVMTQISNSTETLKETVTKNLPSALETAVDNATAMITGADGGYIKLNRDANGKPYEILIMDEEDIADATYIIRLNKNGIGFSSDGGTSYANAWTIDGSLVADFITTGVLNAALAKIGVLSDAAGKNSWNMQTGEILITDGSMTATYADPKVFYLADYDNNPDLNQNVDAVAIRNIVLSGETPTAEQLDRYDFNGDGQIRMSDLIKLRNMILTGKDIVRTRTAIIDPRLESVIKVWETELRDVAHYKTEQTARGYSVSYEDADEEGNLTGSRMVLASDGLIGYTDDSMTAYYPFNGDSVVDYGTSGNWTYRKWNSGVYECWARIEHTVAINSAWGSIYYKSIPRVNYPVEFAESPFEIVSVSGGNYNAWIGGNSSRPTVTQSGSYILMRPASQASTMYAVDYYVRGVWGADIS